METETVYMRMRKELKDRAKALADEQGKPLTGILAELLEKGLAAETETQQQTTSAAMEKLKKLEEVVEFMGEIKLANCDLKENCPLKELGLEPSPLICGLCPIHSHKVPIPFATLETTVYNPFQK